MSAASEPTRPAAAPDRTALAVAVIVGSMLLLSIMDATIKGMTDRLSLAQVMVARALFSVPILLVIVGVGGLARLRKIVRPWVVLRSLLFVGMWFAYYASFAFLDLSAAATALYTAPLFMAGLASVFAGEPVGWRRWLGLAIGFAGVAIILRPGDDAFSVAALLPVLAALLYALAAIVTRNRLATESPFVLALALHVALLASGIAGCIGLALLAPDEGGFLLGGWQTMAAGDWAIMGAMGIVLVAVAAGVAKGYQSGPSAVVGTFDYSYLAFASLWGVLFFSETLDAPTVTGIALIVVAGLLVLWQPRRRALDVPAPASER